MASSTPGTILVDEATGARINVGDVVPDFRGDPHTVLGWIAPHHAGSTGRVIVADEAASFGERTFYPGVINARIVDAD